MASAARIHWSSWAVGLALLIVLGAFSELLYRIEHQRLNEIATGQVLQEVATLRARLESELNPNLHITSGLVGYVTAHDLLEEDRVMTALRVLYRNSRHIRNVALAPDNRIAYIYPLRGNEAALGLNYEQNPQQWPAVREAIAQRQTVLSGPIDLVQGGRGLISRTPVFLEDGNYWGLLSLVLDSDSLFAAAGMDGNSIAGSTWFGLRWDPSSLGATGGPIAGDERVFDEEPVIVTIPVPGGAWELGAIRTDTHGIGSGWLSFYRFGGFGLAVIIAGLVFALLEIRRRIARMALVDQLTGLPNRRWYGRHFQRALQSAERSDERLGLAYIDLDGFKAVNDQLGHRVGDHVLGEIAKRMSDALGRRAFLARVGGDEFVAVFDNAKNSDQVLSRIQPMVDAIRQPITGFAEPIRIDASVGVAMYPDDGDDPGELTTAADQRMYASKTSRKAQL